MSIVTLLVVLVVVLIFVGLALGKITWDRAIILTLVTLVVAAVVWFVLGGGVVGP